MPYRLMIQNKNCAVSTSTSDRTEVLSDLLTIPPSQSHDPLSDRLPKRPSPILSSDLTSATPPRGLLRHSPY